MSTLHPMRMVFVCHQFVSHAHTDQKKIRTSGFSVRSIQLKLQIFPKHITKRAKTFSHKHISSFAMRMNFGHLEWKKNLCLFFFQVFLALPFTNCLQQIPKSIVWTIDWTVVIYWRFSSLFLLIFFKSIGQEASQLSQFGWEFIQKRNFELIYHI